MTLADLSVHQCSLLSSCSAQLLPGIRAPPAADPRHAVPHEVRLEVAADSSRASQVKSSRLLRVCTPGESCWAPGPGDDMEFVAIFRMSYATISGAVAARAIAEIKISRATRKIK